MGGGWLAKELCSQVCWGFEFIPGALGRLWRVFSSAAVDPELRCESTLCLWPVECRGEVARAGRAASRRGQIAGPGVPA